MKKIPVILQVLALFVTIASFSTYLYVNKVFFFKEEPTVAEKAEDISFEMSDDMALAGEEEVSLAVGLIKELFEGEKVRVMGEPRVVRLGLGDSKQVVVHYSLGDNPLLSSLEVIDLSSEEVRSIYRQEGEDIGCHLLETSGESPAGRYLLVEDRTGAAGKYLSAYFLEYDGFGKMKVVDSLADMYNSELFPLANRLILKENDAFYEVVRNGLGVRKMPYDITRSAGLRLISYGRVNGKWVVNDRTTGAIHDTADIVVKRGEEILLVKEPSPGAEYVSTKTILEGSGLEFQKGPPTTIIAKRRGEGRILIVNETEAGDEFEIRVNVKE